MQQRTNLLPDHCWMWLIDTWLAQRCLAMLTPASSINLVCKRSSLHPYLLYLPSTASTAITATHDVCTGSNRLAQKAGDIHVLTPVTEKQQQLQNSHIQEALVRHASLSQVTSRRLCMCSCAHNNHNNRKTDGYKCTACAGCLFI